MSALKARILFRARSRLASFAAWIRTNYWRAAGMKIGPRTLLPKIFVTWPHQIALGADCRLEHGIFFKYDGIWQPGPSLIIGKRVFIGAGCEFNFRRRIEIGSDCLIASGCKFIDHDHGLSRRDLPMAAQVEGAEAAIFLEEDVWLGADVIVLKGTRIARGAVVAAGSVVTNNVPPYEIWAGVPARKIGERPNAP